MKEREAQGGGGGFGRGNGPGGRQPDLRGNTPSAARAGTPTPGGRDMNRGISGNVAPGTTHASGATTIDALFAPLQFTETRGRVWLYENKELRSVPVRLGITDGTYQELIDGDLKEGQEVVVNMVTGLEPVARPGQTGTGNPLMGPQRGGPGGGGNRGGGGGRGF
jgi:hypothetical protein